MLDNASVEYALTALEARVLGALIEKDVTTPEYYPLSLNALVNACNQKNNREPQMSVDEDTVLAALASLEELGLAGRARGSDSRVAKYEHHLQEVFNFTRGETAAICVLLLRGPQTPGELRARTERMFRFEELSDVLATLTRLVQRETPLVRVLPRQPGMKEARFMHLLSGSDEPQPVAGAPGGTSTTQPSAQVEALAEEVATLRREIEALRQEFADFRRQFEPEAQ